ncbi:hypothetical protein JZ751_014110 [Albula glossodonta]|uniref:Uncharacterized protein n=1 Tax=Albula glossodonta TaxID=121402 RepID=A0A8T2P0H0_9TELE|nr:hypothetical protein JZ751_014110 [Albula glossodonta]
MPSLSDTLPPGSVRSRCGEGAGAGGAGVGRSFINLCSALSRWLMRVFRATRLAAMSFTSAFSWALRPCSSWVTYLLHLCGPLVHAEDCLCHGLQLLLQSRVAELDGDGQSGVRLARQRRRTEEREKEA